MAQWHGGKGSAQRKVDKKKFEDNWDKIFGKKNDTDLKFTTAEDFINSVSDDEGTLDGSEEKEAEGETGT
ncbi:hypothetical protein N9H34_00295 [bacterium]|nr:hypothetical protein [bacterium]